MSEESNVIDSTVVDEVDATSDQQPTDKNDNDLMSKLLSADHWLRFVFMFLFAVIASVASYVIMILIIIQFLFALFTGNSEERLQAFGSSLSQYIFQILNFLTYNSDDKPFPFSDWPQANASDAADQGSDVEDSTQD